MNQASEIIYLFPRVNYWLDDKPLTRVPFPSCAAVYYPRMKDTCYNGPRIGYLQWKK